MLPLSLSLSLSLSLPLSLPLSPSLSLSLPLSFRCHPCVCILEPFSDLPSLWRGVCSGSRRPITAGYIHEEGEKPRPMRKCDHEDPDAEKGEDGVTPLHVANPAAPAGLQASARLLPKHVFPLSIGPVMHES